LQTRAGMTGFLPRLFMRSAEEVAREAYRGLSQGRRMVVPGFANRAVTTAIRLSPRSLWLELIARQPRRLPPSPPLPLLARHHARSRSWPLTRPSLPPYPRFAGRGFLAGLPFYATCRNEGTARSRLDPRQ